MHMGTASGAEGQVTGPKIAGPPASIPALSASSSQPPLPQPPPPQTLQEPDLRESDIHEEFDKFTDVLQVLNRFEIDEDLGRNYNVKGNLKKNLEFWVFLAASSFILNVIKFGYRLPFWDVPPAYYSKNNASALKNIDFVENSITELLESERIKQLSYKPHVVNPLSVSVQPNGKKRLILDLRYVNHFIKKLRIKYDDWKIASLMFRKNGYMFSFDLKSGYHHVEIFQPHQTFLGFSWDFQGETRFYVFTVLPFGLSVAPYIFTKILRPLVGWWRANGIYIAVFLDDGWSIADDYNSANIIASRVRSDIRLAGFITNSEKSIWEPTQIITWLGLVWNSTLGTISITPRRVQGIVDCVAFIEAQKCTIAARQLSSFVGKVMSTCPVTGNLPRITTRHCQMTIAIAEHWDTPMILDEYCKDEIVFWKNNIHLRNFKNCFVFRKPQKVTFSDASNIACGAVSYINDGEHVCHKMWTQDERSRSSTWRELSAIEFSLLSCLPILSSSHIKWYTDNQATAKIVEVGSMKLELHTIALRIFKICYEHSIHLDIEWVPRDRNTRADFISKLVDFDDWQVTEDVFKDLDSLWGPHTVDCFATYYNRKITRYFSRFWNPETSGIDAFMQSWEVENCWLVPPVYLIPRTLAYIYSQGAKGTLIVPLWKSAVFWPLLTNIYCSFIQDLRVLSMPQALTHGRNHNSILGSPTTPGYVVALRLNFVPSG